MYLSIKDEKYLEKFYETQENVSNIIKEIIIVSLYIIKKYPKPEKKNQSKRRLTM